MEIRLSKNNIEYCRHLALQRNSNKEDNQVKSYKIDKKQTDEGAHYLGLRGEAAISIICGQPLDDRILLRGDGGVLDFKTPNKLTVQCKTRKDFKDRDDVYLFFNHLSLTPDGKGRGGFCDCHNRWVRNSEVFLADYAYLVVADNHDESLMTVLGSISRNKFLKEYIIKDFSYGPRYAVSHHQLVPVPTDFEERLKKYK